MSVPRETCRFLPEGGLYGVFLSCWLNKAVDFRSRRFAFRGAGGEPPRRFAPAGSHLSSCARRSLRAFHYNQQVLKTTLGYNRAKLLNAFIFIKPIQKKNPGSPESLNLFPSSFLSASQSPVHPVLSGFC
jgi:hypothetical protein